MEKLIKLLPFIVLLIMLSNWRPVSREIMAAVVPVDPGQELYQSIRKTKREIRVVPAQKAVAVVSQNEHVLIEGHKKARSKKVFSAAQFVCGLPIESGTFKTVCKEPKEAEAALKKMKEQGFDEIWLKTPVCGEVYNALVKSARELEMHINA
jgi:hypothetical protein